MQQPQFNSMILPKPIQKQFIRFPAATTTVDLQQQQMQTTNPMKVQQQQYANCGILSYYCLQQSKMQPIRQSYTQQRKCSSY